jgi:hypothetical protein
MACDDLPVRLAAYLAKRQRARRQVTDPDRCPDRDHPTSRALDDGSGILKVFGGPADRHRPFDGATARRCEKCGEPHLMVVKEMVRLRDPDAPSGWKEVTLTQYDAMKAADLLPPL